MLQDLLELKSRLENIISRDIIVNPLIYAKDLQDIYDKNTTHPLAPRILVLIDRMRLHRKNNAIKMELYYLNDINILIKELKKDK